ncbi:MAG: DUF2007 domain-containing protein [Oscillatoriales cyanobacterium RM1_1_9]|nr:DUF2007 domain-containing protein [Oscillatoriales cyanobacterium SM2_3_0]NJO45816.1 DUF2007 domain-containing protein [Oscillatoriales cyanobacterium RM2_1_1]NJO70848.1 DUF2007 domain-containing protein [Oscillatoriales cyanobacterium RM1_1_9]
MFHGDWVTIRTTATRWEAELMQQILLEHEIAVRLVDWGASAYLGMGSLTALQVQVHQEWAARLLTSPVEEDESSDESFKAET